MVGGERCGVSRMVGPCARRLESRHVCKIGKLTRRFKRGDEGGKFVSVGCEQWGAWRLLHHEGPRHCGEELFAHDLLHCREPGLERFH